MRKIIVSNLVSLDGFFEGANKELDWFTVGPHFFEYAREQLNSVDTLLFGRLTYEHIAAYWPTSTGNDSVITDKMNNLPKIGFSKTLQAVEWNNSILVKENIEEEISSMKQMPGKDMVIFGSGELVSSFTRLGLIDEYRIIINPVVLGSGNLLFKGINVRRNLKLTETKILDSGTIILYYESVQN